MGELDGQGGQNAGAPAPGTTGAAAAAPSAPAAATAGSGSAGSGPSTPEVVIQGGADGLTAVERRPAVTPVPLLQVEDLHKTYYPEGRPLAVLRGLSLTLHAGEMTALVGKSGSGKSTFLHIAGTLDAPTRGRVRFCGDDLFTRSETELARFRNRTVGFVFQSNYLLPEFSALENVMMPALVQHWKRATAEESAAKMLEAVGLGARLRHRPAELSGGEQQRVAIARALVMGPRLLLADEPTGNLDDATGEEIYRLLSDLNARHGISAVIVTHSERLAARMPRRLRLVEGRVVDEIV